MLSLGKKKRQRAATPARMQAVVIEQFGGPEVLKLQTPAAQQPSHEEVLLRVAAVGINPVDWKTRNGQGVARQIKGLRFVPG